MNVKMPKRSKNKLQGGGGYIFDVLQAVSDSWFGTENFDQLAMQSILETFGHDAQQALLFGAAIAIGAAGVYKTTKGVIQHGTDYFKRKIKNIGLYFTGSDNVVIFEIIPTFDLLPSKLLGADFDATDEITNKDIADEVETILMNFVTDYNKKYFGNPEQEIQLVVLPASEAMSPIKNADYYEDIGALLYIDRISKIKETQLSDRTARLYDEEVGKLSSMVASKARLEKKLADVEKMIADKKVLKALSAKTKGEAGALMRLKNLLADIRGAVEQLKTEEVRNRGLPIRFFIQTTIPNKAVLNNFITNFVNKISENYPNGFIFAPVADENIREKIRENLGKKYAVSSIAKRKRRTALEEFLKEHGLQEQVEEETTLPTKLKELEELRDEIANEYHTFGSQSRPRKYVKLDEEIESFAPPAKKSR